MHISHFRKSKIAPTNEQKYYVQIQLLRYPLQPHAVISAFQLHRSYMFHHSGGGEELD